MGREIVYCFNCSTRVTEQDFERGRATRTSNKVVCGTCAAELGIETRAPQAATPRRGTSTRMQRTRPPTEPRIEAAPPSKKFVLTPKLMLIAGGGGAAFLLAIILLIVMLSGGEDPPAAANAPSAVPAKPPKSAPSKPPGSGVPLSRGELVARKALLKARQYGQLNPRDISGRIRELKAVAFQFDGSQASRDAMKEAEELQKELRAGIDAALKPLDESLKPLIKDELFGKAVLLLEAERKKRRETEWTLEIDRRIREATSPPKRMLPDLLDQAEEAKIKGDTATVEKIQARVRKWGISKHSAELQEALDALVLEKPGTPKVAAAKKPDTSKPAAPAKPKKPEIPADTPPKTAEEKAYRAAWEEALLLAAVRDHEGALGKLAAAKSALRKADEKDLRAVEALWKQAIETLSTLPKWRRVVLDVRDGSGKITRIEGQNVEAGPERIELKVEKKKETVFVEFSDLAGTCLPEILKGEKPDARALALVCLTEGEVEAAKKVLGAKLDRAAGRYWAYAKGAPSRIARPRRDPRELSALTLFYQAERQYRSMRTYGAAIQKYATLLNDYAGVGKILRNINRIERRSREGREFVFVGRELKGEGTFTLTDHETEGKVWISVKDSEEFETLYNFVDVQFYALPELDYRLFLRVGGCCKDNFFFFYQATDLQVPDPEDRRKMVSVPPGSDAAMDVKHRIFNLKKTHASHSKGPKTAERWEWVEIPLGKEPPPGFKHVRVLTNQAGFGVAGAIVSTTLKRAPSKKDTRALLDAREAEVPKVTVDPSLVGYWTFDEGDGTTAADRTPQQFAGTLEKGPKWVEGRVGGALQFDGKAAWVKVPDHEVLRITGDMTIAFWMKKTAESKDWARLVGKGEGNDRNYGVWEENGGGKRILWQHYAKGGKNIINLYSKSSVAAGKWTHVAAVIEGNKGSIYINGKLDVSATRSGTPVTTSAALTIGRGPQHTGYSGALDDVRIYNRALTAEEIQALAGQ